MLRKDSPTDVVVIIDGIAYALKATLKRATHEADMVRLCKSAASWSTGIMPQGTRYVTKTEHESTIVVERPPTTLVARFQPAMGSSVRNLAVPVWIPWQVYIIKLVGGHPSVRMFWSRRPLQTLRSELLTAVMPNMYADGQVCLGVHNIVTSDIYQAAEGVIQHMMASSFNNDLMSVISECTPKEIAAIAPPTEFCGNPISPQEIHGCVAYILSLNKWAEGMPNPQTRICEVLWPISRQKLSEML